MAHEIETIDRGVVMGTTWHGLPQYQTQDTPVTLEQARKVVDFPMEKVQLYRKQGNELVPVQAWAVVRTDHNTVVCDSVGSDFLALDNLSVLNMVEVVLLQQFPEMVIESVGTLRGGAITFVNIKVNEVRINTDKSSTINRIMYYNPIGLGSYKTGCHSIRIVCRNTLRMAESEAAMNSSLRKVAHTESSVIKLATTMVDLSRYYLGLKTWEERYNRLAAIQMDSAKVDTFFNNAYPVPKVCGRQVLRNRGVKIDLITKRFESDQHLTDGRTAYAMVQAVTGFYDHDKTDESNIADVWDSLVGGRMMEKERVVSSLLSTVGCP